MLSVAAAQMNDDRAIPLADRPKREHLYLCIIIILLFIDLFCVYNIFDRSDVDRRRTNEPRNGQYYYDIF